MLSSLPLLSRCRDYVCCCFVVFVVVGVVAVRVATVVAIVVAVTSARYCC